MYKYLFLMVLAFPCHALVPTKIQVEILHACQRQYDHKGPYCVNKCFKYTKIYYESTLACEKDRDPNEPKCHHRTFNDPACK